jgi:hypothetical protein
VTKEDVITYFKELDNPLKRRVWVLRVIDFLIRRKRDRFIGFRRKNVDF